MIPVPVSPAWWVGPLLWLAALAVVSFLVTWVAADKVRMRRTPYIAVLTVVAAMTAAYTAWSGISVTAVLTIHWGLAAAPLSGAFLIVGMTRLPVTRRLTGRRLGLALLWEGVVYGTRPSGRTWRSLKCAAGGGAADDPAW